MAYLLGLIRHLFINGEELRLVLCCGDLEKGDAIDGFAGRHLCFRDGQAVKGKFGGGIYVKRFLRRKKGRNYVKAGGSHAKVSPGLIQVRDLATGINPFIDAIESSKSSTSGTNLPMMSVTANLPLPHHLLEDARFRTSACWGEIAVSELCSC